nr:MAG TPA: hypothetical protein [Caudoviricetes sp.]
MSVPLLIEKLPVVADTDKIPVVLLTTLVFVSCVLTLTSMLVISVKEAACGSV